MRPTLAQAVQDLEGTPSRGFHFLEEGAGGAIEETCVSFPELARLAAARAGALQERGLAKGDRLALVLPQTQEFVVSFLGAVLAGIIPVPIYPPTGMARLDRYAGRLASILARCRPGAVLASPELSPALAALPLPDASRAAPLTPEQLGDDAPFRPEKIERGDIAFLQYTSGSTAQPKGVCVTHENIASNTGAIHGAFGLSGDDVPVSFLPLFHDMGLIGFLITALYATAATRFMPTQMFLRRPGSWLRALSRHRGSISVAPSFAFDLVARRLKDDEIEKLDLSAWRIAGCGAEPVRAADLERFAARFAPAGFRREAFLPMYGLAEATLAVTIPPRGRGLRSLAVDAEQLRAERKAAVTEAADGLHVASCGPALAVNEVEIFAPDDADSARPLGDGRVGEIRLRGRNVFSAYWEDPDATREAFAGGYLRTGDLGFVHDGELYVCGRIKELIIVNGRNYAPDDVERAALGVPGVRAALAFQSRAAARGDAGNGRVVVAVETGVPERLDRVSIHRAVGAALGLVPDEVVLLAPGQIPKTSSGKPQRVEARRQYEAGLLRRAPRRRPALATGFTSNRLER